MELSLYRKYRPQTFDQVAGQDHVSRTLQNAVRGGAVAHAYVFAGPRGIGKTSMAKILAKALNCTGPDGSVTEPTVTPCGVCESCRSIAAGTSLDVIEMDAASNRGIDDIRELRDKVAFAPVMGRSKVYIIDEVHMLTKEAFNALLKTLEEPPPHVVFVLATTEAHKIPATILSRCQRFDFRKPRVQDIAKVLAQIAAAEKIDVDDPAILEIARHAEGGFRDAIGTLEKLATFFGDRRITSREVLDVLGVIESEVLFEIVDIVIDRDAAGALLFVQRLAERGTSYTQFIHDLLRHLRQVFLVQYLDEVSEDASTLRALSQNLEVDEQLLDRLEAQAHQLGGRELLRFVELLGAAQTEIRAGLDSRLQLELALVKAARPQVDHGAEALEERLRRLEGVSVPVPPSRSAGRAAKASPPPKATPAQPAAAAAAADEAPAAKAPVDEAPVQAADTTADGDPVAGEDEGAVAGGAEAPAATAPQPDPPAECTHALWPTILSQVEGQSVELFAALRDARVKVIDGDRLRVTLPSAIALAKATARDNADLLASIVRATTTCEPPRFDFVVDSQAAAASPAQTTGPGDDASLTIAQRLAMAKRELNAVEVPDEDWKETSG
jgi:DNA polymerase-3 subunit gamma/tau